MSEALGYCQDVLSFTDVGRQVSNTVKALTCEATKEIARFGETIRSSYHTETDS